MKNRNMKRLFCVICVICLAAISLAGCGNNDNSAADTPAPAPAPAADASPDGSATPDTSAANDEPHTFKLSFNGAPTSVAADAYQLFCDKANEYTGGSVTIEFYPGGTLINEAETMDAIMDGIVDMAHLGVTYMSPTIKELSVLEVPGMFRSERYFEYAYGLKDVLSEVCEPYGIKYLIPASTGQVSFPSSKTLIKQPSDLKGLNVRVSGKYQGEAVKAWGGNPVSIPIGEIAQALDRGTVDAAYAGNTTLIDSFKLYEMVDNISQSDIGEIIVGLIMNLDSWNSLTDNQKTGISKALDDMTAYLDVEADNFYEQYLKKVADAGKEIYIMTPEESQAFVDLSLDVALPQALEVAGPKGQEIVDLCLKIKELQDKSEYQNSVIPDYDWIQPGY
jgi:C4-dicarboxylate-binding protein DctP